MRKFDITVEGHYPSRSDYHYHDNGEFVRAEIAEDMYEALEKLSLLFTSANEVSVERATIKRDSGHYRMLVEALAKARGEGT